MPPIARTAVLDVPRPAAPRGNPLSAAPNWVDPTYDDAGNMTHAPRPWADPRVLARLEKLLSRRLAPGRASRPRKGP